MRTFLITLTIVCKNLVFAQDSAEKLSDKAFGFYVYNKNIDSALYYYQLLQQTYPDFRPAYINNVIGSCYLEKRYTELAKNYFILSLRIPDSLDTHSERACLKIGDIFLAAVDYSKALAYYDSSTSYYRTKVLRMSRHRFREGNIETIYKKAICFDKLNRLDTAINILTPYIFIDFDNYIIESTNPVNIVDFYLTLLRKKYNKKQIRNEFKQAMNGITYKREVDSFMYQRNPEWKYILIDCSFDFLDKKVNIFGGGIGVSNFDEPTPIGWRKEDILKEFHKSLAYKKLRKI